MFRTVRIPMEQNRQQRESSGPRLLGHDKTLREMSTESVKCISSVGDVRWFHIKQRNLLMRVNYWQKRVNSRKLCAQLSILNEKSLWKVNVRRVAFFRASCDTWLYGKNILQVSASVTIHTRMLSPLIPEAVAIIIIINNFNNWSLLLELKLRVLTQGILKTFRSSRFVRYCLFLSGEWMRGALLEFTSLNRCNLSLMYRFCVHAHCTNLSHL